MPFLKSTCVPFRANNVDTDQIIPARYLKAVTRDEVKEGLFRDWKYNKDGSENSDFVLNKPEYKSAKILIAQNNFGCGSSREHAPWAIHDNGFRAILAISFADIFRNNCLKNEILPIELPENIINKLLDDIENNPKLEIEINLENQIISIPNQGDFEFQIDPFRKTCILKKVDEIGYTLGFEEKIKKYENNYKL
ncbi:3-isopropylmalate dehydratase small subunit [Candidatus Peregrinibacteria bacterium RIFOXYB2_FULL_32_7]|nr:MAG: 3-isopropylmalate dehydratase small subunit [Candidatus Peregrinibacteria bacterium RIFOXYB2_FULL_32_7]